jgi:hypothetical protein
MTNRSSATRWPTAALLHTRRISRQVACRLRWLSKAHSEVTARWPVMSMFASVGCTTNDNGNRLDDMITDLPVSWKLFDQTSECQAKCTFKLILRLGREHCTLRIFLPRGGDAIIKMFAVPQAEEVDQCPIYNKSTVPFSAFTVNSPLLCHPKQPSLLLCWFWDNNNNSLWLLENLTEIMLLEMWTGRTKWSEQCGGYYSLQFPIRSRFGQGLSQILGI